LDRTDITNLFIKKEANRKLHMPQVIGNFDDIINSNLGYLVLNKMIPHDIIAKEIANVESLFVEHRSEYDESKGWFGFCLHGKSYDATREDSYYKDNRNMSWTAEAEKMMPNTVNFFKNDWFGNSFARLRIMKLIPGGYINCHRDCEKPSQLGAINIAITNPEGNMFLMENWGVVPFEKGRCIMLNLSNIHAVVNNSSKIRYHIIVHHLDVTDAFKRTVINSANPIKS